MQRSRFLLIVKCVIDRFRNRARGHFQFEVRVWLQYRIITFLISTVEDWEKSQMASNRKSWRATRVRKVWKCVAWTVAYPLCFTHAVYFTLFLSPV